MKRQIIIRNPLNDFPERWDCFSQRFRYYLIGKLLTKYEVERMCNTIDKASKVIERESVLEADFQRREELKEDYCELWKLTRHISIDFKQTEFKDFWQ